MKIILGYAAGSGKTYQMLDEGHDLLRRGVDVVIGYFEPHGRKDTIEMSEGLESVPRKAVTYRNSAFEEMDTDAILERNPQVCLVDELAHTNVPGSERDKRWRDVAVLRDAGIDVLTTLNVQHIESLNDPVQQMTGVRVRETVPDWLVNEADEVVLVDITPRALRNRLQRGVVYAPEKAEQAMSNFFTEANLSALRELALRQTALRVEDRLNEEVVTATSASHKEGKGLSQAGETIMICLSPDPHTARLIRRGRRLADFFQARCIGVYVTPILGSDDSPQEVKTEVDKHLRLASSLHMETRLLNGSDVARTIVDYAREQKATQLLIGRIDAGGFMRLRRPNLVDQVVRLALDLDITIVA